MDYDKNLTTNDWPVYDELAATATDMQTTSIWYS